MQEAGPGPQGTPELHLWSAATEGYHVAEHRLADYVPSQLDPRPAAPGAST